jgi:hypothetical protein
MDALSSCELCAEKLSALLCWSSTADVVKGKIATVMFYLAKEVSQPCRPASLFCQDFPIRLLHGCCFSILCLGKLVQHGVNSPRLSVVQDHLANRIVKQDGALRALVQVCRIGPGRVGVRFTCLACEEEHGEIFAWSGPSEGELRGWVRMAAPRQRKRQH